MIAAACLASGCAHYASRPLRAPDVVLAPPELAILSADARAIDRPFLAPQPIDLGQPLTPAALAIIAVLENPDLKALRAKTGVVDAQAFAARLLPDPTIQGSFDKLLSGPDSFNALAGQFALDLGALRTAAVVRAGGAANRRQVRLDLAWAEWQTAGQARLQAVRILALERQQAIAQESAASAEHLLVVTRAAAARGDLAGGEVDPRRQAAVDADTRLRATELDLGTARGELARLLGLPPHMILRLAAPPTPPEPPTAEALIREALARRLDLRALRAGYDAAEADVHKAVLDQFPNLQLTATGGRDTSNNYTLGPSIGVTLPLWNRNRGGIAVARATREQLRAEYDARLFQTRAEIAAASDRLHILRQQRRALLAQMEGFERYADAAARAARRGDLAPATAEGAAQAIRDRRLTALQLEQQIAEQTIALELLTGGPSEGWTR